jgi:hypothetical protein
LDVDVTFSHQDDPDFCLEEHGEGLDDEEKERAFWEASADEDVEDDGYKDDGQEDDLAESCPEDLTLWMPSYVEA